MVNLLYQDFYQHFCGKVLRANGSFDPKQKLRTSLD